MQRPLQAMSSHLDEQPPERERVADGDGIFHERVQVFKKTFREQKHANREKKRGTHWIVEGRHKDKINKEAYRSPSVDLGGA